MDIETGNIGTAIGSDVDNQARLDLAAVYRLLAQRSVVFKQTLFEEWHDDRLVPWIHYIPVSLQMTELPEIMTYLAGTAEGKRHSEEIANAGYEWSRQVVRRIDLSIYMYRLMLEMAELFKPAQRDS